MNKHNVKKEYTMRKNKYFSQFKEEKKKYDKLSNLRLMVFGGIILGGVFIYYNYSILGAGIILCSIISFIYLVLQHEEVKKKKEMSYALMNVNQKSLDRINGKWKKSTNKGELYVDVNHQYSYDLDVFGHASLYQWISEAFTYTGKHFLKNVLINPVKKIEEIRKRQSSILELADNLDWRQNFLASGSFIKNENKSPESLIKWAEKITRLFEKTWVRVGIKMMSTVTVLSILFTFLIHVYFIYLAFGMLFINAILFLLELKYYSNVFEVAIKNKNTISVYKDLLNKIENESFKSEYINEIKSNLLDSKKNSTSKQIKKLSIIVEMMSLKYSNVFYLIINLFFLWDYHCIVALEKWKRKSGKNIRKWVEGIGKFEELLSFSNIPYENSKWAIPKFVEKKHTFLAKEMGHPLLHPEERICNNLSINGFGNILLITGSNMSGKSTLLRTVGINLVLAYSGAPVCAKDFTCSVMDVYTSMRVNDNLEKKISSFYAELLKIKTIVEAANKDNSILFLLDEIFRGTNTKDRHLGAKAVLKKLGQIGAIGLVSTHDLELGELEEDKEINVKNYHFTEKYINEKIIFDYKLYPGISKTTNAIYLMKMVGISDF
ncbi:hypothetical protein RBH29_12620 [Herbivorax sp. ANBcel31]|uniref:MutS family DNA mismatch repair protein n=1 Tax=Herbivorax sp. ANBcel31 TaxID=3069754 RepID=UPI0027B3A03B|nr:MutS family DNA mismatch repair protein [Herbivorax sp. ANBcel31]MDQ2087268.1 hypothetical protein [Herbivorax sp. ANBcel31]